MKVIKHNHPWDWFEVHNFISEEHFQAIKAHANTLERYDERSMHVVKKGWAYDIIADAMEDLCDSIGFKIENNHEIVVQFDIIKPGWAYNKIHSDHEKKLVTFVMAISDEGTGTQLYSNDKSTYIKTTDWIPNGGNGFIRKDNTWHDFDSKGLNDYRVTAIVMLAEKGWDV